MNLQRIISELSQEQKKELSHLLNRDLNVPKLNQLISEMNKAHPMRLPSYSIDNRYERWIKSFYGVATKYLSGYLN